MVSEDVRGRYLLPERFHAWVWASILKTRREDVLPNSQIVSQVSTEDVPFCIRTYDLATVCHAFNVPPSLLRRTH